MFTTCTLKSVVFHNTRPAHKGPVYSPLPAQVSWGLERALLDHLSLQHLGSKQIVCIGTLRKGRWSQNCLKTAQSNGGILTSSCSSKVTMKGLASTTITIHQSMQVWGGPLEGDQGKRRPRLLLLESEVTFGSAVVIVSTSAEHFWKWPDVMKGNKKTARTKSRWSQCSTAAQTWFRSVLATL